MTEAVSELFDQIALLREYLENCPQRETWESDIFLVQRLLGFRAEFNNKYPGGLTFVPIPPVFLYWNDCLALKIEAEKYLS